jgi:hypothetical protein
MYCVGNDPDMLNDANTLMLSRPMTGPAGGTLDS